MTTVQETLVGRGCKVMVGSVLLDAAVSTQHALTAQVTDHTVELGADISDNYKPGLRTLRVEGVITDSPLEVGYPAQTAINSIRSLADGDTSPSESAWREFRRMFDEAEVIDIITETELYTSMVLTSVEVTKTADTANRLVFSLAAREVRFVSLETTEAIKLPEPKDTTDEVKKKNKGKQKAKPEATSSDKQQSILKQGIEALFG